MTLERERLVAYADGELNAVERLEIEALLESDPEAREDLEALLQQRSDLTAAFATDLVEPLPERTLGLFSGGLVSGGPGSGLAGLAWWKPAIAAGLAALVFGGAAAFGVAELRTDQLIARYEAERSADRAELAVMVQQALENSPSGQAVQWGGEAGQSAGEVTPLRTFQTAEGDWCREYRAKARIGLEVLARRAIACRTTSGTWETRIERDQEHPLEQAPSNA